jgi:hypothetical protein
MNGQIQRKWSDVYPLLQGMPERQALFVALAWMAAVDSKQPALLSNLLCNTLHPTGVLNSLDWAGLELPWDWDKVADCQAWMMEKVSPL